MRSPAANRRTVLLKLGLGLGAAVAALAGATAIRLQLQGQNRPAPQRGEVGPVDPIPNLAVTELPDASLAERGIMRRNLGSLLVQHGRIVAADPAVQPERAPFARPVPQGSHPVFVYMAQRRVALAELRFAEGSCTDWPTATLAGQDAATLKPGEIFGYPVDAGLGCFMDTAGQAAFSRRSHQEEARLKGHFNPYDDLIASPLNAAGGAATLFKPLPDSAANVAVFESGWGDGFYASYWGLDAAGRTLRLVTDFLVLEAGDGRDRATDASTTR